MSIREQLIGFANTVFDGGEHTTLELGGCGVRGDIEQARSSGEQATLLEEGRRKSSQSTALGFN